MPLFSFPWRSPVFHLFLTHTQKTWYCARGGYQKKSEKVGGRRRSGVTSRHSPLCLFKGLRLLLDMPSCSFSVLLDCSVWFMPSLETLIVFRVNARVKSPPPPTGPLVACFVFLMASTFHLSTLSREGCDVSFWTELKCSAGDHELSPTPCPPPFYFLFVFFWFFPLCPPSRSSLDRTLR